MDCGGSHTRTRFAIWYLPSGFQCFGWYMAIRKIWPDAVSRSRSRASRTQPVPSMAGCFVGSARTEKTASAGALIVMVALTESLVIWGPPEG
jgi:hypothetical protein